MIVCGIGALGGKGIGDMLERNASLKRLDLCGENLLTFLFQFDVL
jgi:hypothetical protein